MTKLYDIGGLRLDTEARVLTDRGAPVAIGARGVAVLTALVRRANEHVSKASIMDAAWPGLVVEEANLAVQISAIRRVLARVPGGENWIETLARRGYRFVGPVAQIADGQSPPLPADRERTNLPQALTSFVGRGRELAEITRLLPETRLLTLTGTGGIGKTRLALQAASGMLGAYRDGIWFVDLAPLLDPALVPSALAEVLGVKEAAGQPLLATLCEYLRGKELLLILDNCEHVLAASAGLAEALLRETERVNVAATSRESLHVENERMYPLDVLPIPDPKADAATIARSDAVQLFVERARQHRPRFDLQGPRARAVAEICVRLDGLPLALELAAARVAVLPVEEIGRLLDQRFRLLTSGSRAELARHETLRAMLDWSYELLDDAEKHLFARLSVFAGGWTVAAAEAVGAGRPIAASDVVYLLIALIEKSLVVADDDGDRYHMLETVREYARARLSESAFAEEMGVRHRDYFLGLAEDAEPKLTGAEQAEWLQRLAAEHDNLRAALAASLAANETGHGLRLSGAMLRLWSVRGHLVEGRQWCQTFLDAPTVQRGSPEYGKGLNTAGVLAYLQSDYPSALAWLKESLALRRRLDDRSGIANSLNNLGNVAYEQGDYAGAVAHYGESLSIRRESGDRIGMARSLGNLGNIAHEEGKLADAKARYEECLALMRESGDLGGIGHTLVNLGEVTYEQGDVPRARELLEEGLAMVRQLDERAGTARTLNILGNIALDQGELAAAATIHQESLAIRRALGEKRGIAYSLEAMAAVFADSGDPLRAARVWGAAERLREQIGAPLTPNDRPGYARRAIPARTARGDEAAFDRAWQEGRASSLEQAIGTALARTSNQ